MSIEIISKVLKLDVKPSSCKFVLVALANCANDEDRTCYPSVKYLCDATSQDRKTVLENLKKLKNMGLISDTGNRKGFTGQVIVYKIITENFTANSAENGTIKQSQNRNSTENGTVPKFPPNSPVFPVKESRFSHETVPKTGHGNVNEPSLEPLIETSVLKTTQKNKKTEKTFTEYEDDCLQNGVDLIPENSEPMVLAGKLGLDGEMMELFWDEFYAAHTDPASKSFAKKQACWLKTISVYMRKNYFKIWDFDRATGEAYLTSTGKSLAKIRSAT